MLHTGSKTMPILTESTVEEAAMELFSGLGYSVLYGRDIALDELCAQRTSYEEVTLIKRLRRSLARIGPTIPAEVVEEIERGL